METQGTRWGLPESITGIAILAVAVIVVVAVLGGATIALVPGLTFALAVGASYALYRRYAPIRPRVAVPSRADYFVVAGLLVVAGAVAVALVTGWPIALVPGIAYALALATAYLLYQQHARETAQVLAPSIALAERKEMPAASARAGLGVVAGTVAFRVVGAHGTCLIGRSLGDLVTVGAAGSVSPRVCPQAEAVLRLAAAGDGDVREWCCPIYDHLLVFRREGELTSKAA
ncbi:MAG: hypothetical protein HY685_04155 [Chloroflexi bacterium]|nr:hypothetical protein [Chloroflexota bacterium]